MVTAPPTIFLLGFSGLQYLSQSNMKRCGSSWAEFSSSLQSALLEEHRRKCKDCKHIECLASEDRLSPRWSPMASSHHYSVGGGEKYHLLPLSRGKLCLRPLDSRGPVSKPVNGCLATATLCSASWCFLEMSLYHVVTFLAIINASQKERFPLNAHLCKRE